MKIKIGLSVNVCSWEYESRKRNGEHKGRVGKSCSRHCSRRRSSFSTFEIG